MSGKKKSQLSKGQRWQLQQQRERRKNLHGDDDAPSKVWNKKKTGKTERFCTHCKEYGHVVEKCCVLDPCHKCEGYHRTEFCRTPFCDYCKKPFHATADCYYHNPCPCCGETGHPEERCRKKFCTCGDVPKHSALRCRRKKKCHNCGEMGHVKRFCPERLVLRVEVGKRGEEEEYGVRQPIQMGRKQDLLDLCLRGLSDRDKEAFLNLCDFLECTTCGKEGHLAESCDLQKCTTCGKEGHLAESCDLSECTRCGQKGHLKSKCKKCFKCKSWGHVKKDCFKC